MNKMVKELLEDIKTYRNDMVAKNYPHQQISDIITKWENKLIEKDRWNNFHARAIDGYSE
mgnify:CR=1 FL=1